MEGYPSGPKLSGDLTRAATLLGISSDLIESYAARYPLSEEQEEELDEADLQEIDARRVQRGDRYAPWDPWAHEDFARTLGIERAPDGVEFDFDQPGDLAFEAMPPVVPLLGPGMHVVTLHHGLVRIERADGEHFEYLQISDGISGAEILGGYRDAEAVRPVLGVEEAKHALEEMRRDPRTVPGMRERVKSVQAATQSLEVAPRVEALRLYRHLARANEVTSQEAPRYAAIAQHLIEELAHVLGIAPREVRDRWLRN